MGSTIYLENNTQSLSKINKVIDGVTNLIGSETDYDIWVKWDKNDGGDWTYRERIKGTRAISANNSM